MFGNNNKEKTIRIINAKQNYNKPFRNMSVMRRIKISLESSCLATSYTNDISRISRAKS